MVLSRFTISSLFEDIKNNANKCITVIGYYKDGRIYNNETVQGQSLKIDDKETYIFQDERLKKYEGSIELDGYVYSIDEKEWFVSFINQIRVIRNGQQEELSRDTFKVPGEIIKKIKEKALNLELMSVNEVSFYYSHLAHKYVYVEGFYDSGNLRLFSRYKYYDNSLAVDIHDGINPLLKKVGRDNYTGWLRIVGVLDGKPSVEKNISLVAKLELLDENKKVVDSVLNERFKTSELLKDRWDKLI